MNGLERGRFAILGAFVGDAAALGLHWLYDPERLQNVAPSKPEFLNPQAKFYEGGVGYFAHGQKKAGDLTHYGEQMAVMLRSLARQKGQWKPFDYLSEFQSSFDQGGSFSGYIDRATRETLENLKLHTQSLTQKVEENFAGLPNDLRQYALRLASYEGKRFTGEALLERAKKVIAESGQSASQELLLPVIRFYDQERSTKVGADDAQLPAFSKLVPLVVAYAQAHDFKDIIEEAIRTTNNNEIAVSYASFGALTLREVLRGKPVLQAITVAAAESHPGVQKAIDAALNYSESDLLSLGEHFGRACNVDMAFPLSVALLRHHATFTHAIRANIMVGGDSAGRGIFIGALLGAQGLGSAHGIPFAYLARLNQLRDFLLWIDAATVTPALPSEP